METDVFVSWIDFCAKNGKFQNQQWKKGETFMLQIRRKKEQNRKTNKNQTIILKKKMQSKTRKEKI